MAKNARERAEISRRMLIVGGGIVVGATVAVGWKGGSHLADGTLSESPPSIGPGPSTHAAAPASPAPHKTRQAATHVAKPKSRHEARLTGAENPGPPAREPVFYVDDGPKVIALTIDDGPSPVYTPQVLRLLAKYNVTAAFSMIGENASYYPGIARDVADAGHMIVNHTWDHSNLAKLSPSRVGTEIARATQAIHDATGVLPRMFRAPYGSWSKATLEYCAGAGLTPLDWSVDPRDWSRPGVSEIVRTIMKTTRTGSIILEHDGGGNRSQTVAALGIVIPRLLDEGYRFRLP